MKRATRPSPKRPRSVRRSPELRAYLRKLERFRAGRDPIVLLKTGPTRIARAVQGLTRRQMLRRPARGKWSILEILGHLHDTEVVYGWRWRLTAAEPGSTLLDYDQDTWTRELRHRQADPKRLLAQIAAMRAGSVDVVLRVPRRTWKQAGFHTSRGREPLERSLRQIAGHDFNHIAQIRAIREKYGF